jgi:cell division septation protein DedD
VNQRTLAALALLAGCLAVVLAVGALPDPAGASHGEQQANITVDPGTHDTGAQEVSYRVDAELTDDVDGYPIFGSPDRIVLWIEGGTLSGCEPGPLGSANYEIGVNRSTPNGDEYHTYTVAGATWGNHSVEFTFDDQDDDDQPNYGQGDSLEIRLDSCVENAGEDDWYLAAVNVTGESRRGKPMSFGRPVPSHYYGICDGCESDADARDAMGNPPTEPTPTPTPTPTATSTPTPTPNPYPTAGPTDTETETPTPTPTETSTPTATNGTEGTDGPAGRPPVDAEFLGMDPLAVVAVVAVVSIALAALGARRL